MKRISRILTIALVLILGLSALYTTLPLPAPALAQEGPDEPPPESLDEPDDPPPLPASAPPAAANSSIDPATTNLPNDGTPGTVTVTIRDDFNAPVSGIPVTLSPGAFPAGVNVFPLSGNTNALGQFQATVTSSAPVPPTNSITLTATYLYNMTIFNVPGQAVFNFFQAPAVPGFSSISPAFQAVQADGLQTATITVTLNAQNGQPTPGKQVNLTVVAPDTADGLVFPLGTTQTTGSNGIAIFTVRSTVAKLVNFRVQNVTDGFELPTPPATVQVNFTPAPPNGANSSASAAPTTAFANGVDPITITVTSRDAGNNLLAGSTVSILGTPPFVTLDAGSKVTDASGTVTFTATSLQPVAGLTFSVSITGPGPGTVGLTTNAVTFLDAPAIEANSTITGPQTAPADGVSTRQITVTLRNAGNNPSVGKSVTLTALPSAGVSISPLAGTTDINGQITFTVASSVVNNVTFTAVNNTDGFTLTTSVDFTPAPTDPNVSTVTRDPPTGSIPADGVTTVTITVTLRNAGGGVVPGKTVSLGPTVAPPPGVLDIQPDPVNTDPALGVFVFDVTATSTTPLTVTFQAADTTDSIIITQTVTVTFSTPPANDAQSTVNVVGEVPPNPLGVQADGVSSATIEVTLRDLGGNPAPNKLVSLAASPAAGVTFNPVSQQATTNLSGVATFTVRSTQIALVTFTATVITDGNLVLSDTGQVNFTDAPAIPANSTINVNPASVLANGIAESTITVVLRNAGNNFAVGKLLFLDASAAPNPGALIFPTDVFQASNSNGQAVFRVRSTVAQTVTFVIRNQTDGPPNDVVGNAIVNFTPSGGPVAGANSSISVSPTTANADDSETVTITAILRDASNTVVQGRNAELVVNPPLPAGTTLTPGVTSGPSNTEGRVTWTLRSSVPGTFTFTATVSVDSALINNVTPGGSNTVTFNPVGSPVSATNSSVQVISGNPAPADGASPITIRVTLRDGTNAPLAGLGVTLSSSRGGVDTFTPAGPVITNASGEANFQVTSNTAGVAQITAVGDGITLAQQPNITFNPLGSPVDAFTSTINVSGPAPANGVAEITVVVTLRDTGSNPVSGQIVTLSTSRGSPVPDNVQPAFSTSNASGQATFTITSVQAGSGTLTAVGGGVTLATNPTYTFNPVVSPVDPGTSTVVVSPPSVPANGTSAILVTVTVRNNASTPLNGIPVSISTNPAVQITVLSGTTNGSGIAQFELRSTVAHPSVTITVVADGVTLNQQPVVAFSALPVDPNTTTLSASPMSVPADGVTPITITVTVRDVNNNPIQGKTVSISSSRGATDSIQNAAPGSNVTNALGQATFQVRSGTVGNPTISAVADSVPINNTIQIGFSSTAVVSPTLSTIAASPLSAPADGTTPITITVTVRDASNNPLVGKAVTISSAPGGVTITPAGAAISDVNGEAVFQVRSNTAGGRTISAVADSVALSNTVSITFTGVAAVDPTLSTISASPLSVAADGVTPINVTVTARDSGGNLLPGRTVTISSSRGASDTITPASVVTDGSGQAVFQVRSSTVGSAVISAVAGSVALTNTVTVGFSSTAAVSPTLSTVIATNSPQPAGGTPIQIIVTVRDAANNPLAGKPVTITATPNTGITITPGGGSSVSDGAGQAIFQVSSTGQAIVSISAVADSVALTNTATISFTAPLGPPDLLITKSVTGAFTAGVASPFNFAVQNIGTGPTTGSIVISDTLAPGMRYWGTMGDTHAFSCQAVGQLVTCTRTSPLNASELVQVQILVNPDPAVFTTSQTFNNTATITTPGDLNPANNTSTVSVTVNPLNPNQIFEGNSLVTVSPTQVPADNQARSTISITLRNLLSQPVAGAQVTLQPSVTTGLTIETAPTLTSDANGLVSFQVRSSAPQTVTFTIIATSSAGSVTFNNRPTVTFGAGGTGGPVGTVSAATSTVVTDCTSIPANNVAQATITVTLKDANNNPVPGRVVTLTANPSPATLLLTPVSGTTSAADGTVRWTVRSSAQGSAIFTASTTDQTLIFINQTATVTFTAPGTQPVCTAQPIGQPTAVGGVTDPRLLTVPTGPTTGRVVAWRLRVRTGPGLDFQILGLLRYGTEVSIIAKNSRGTWFQIQLEEGTAWVSANWVRVTRSAFRGLPVVDGAPGTAPLVPVPSGLIPQFGEGIGRVNTYLLRVRTGPGLDYQQVGLLREGTEVLLLGISPDRRWYKIRTDDGDRWISAFYVRVIRINGNRLPVVEPEPRP